MKSLCKLVNLEKSLVYFTTSIKANEILMARIQRSDIIKMSEHERELLDDAITENLQAIHMTKIYSNILSGMMDAFASIISNNLNVVMKFLTTVTIMLMIPNLVFSFFGQNVKIPIGEHEYGLLFTLVTAVIATLAGVADGCEKTAFLTAEGVVSRPKWPCGFYIRALPPLAAVSVHNGRAGRSVPGLTTLAKRPISLHLRRIWRHFPFWGKFMGLELIKPNVKFRFSRYRKYAYILSTVLVLVGIALW